MSSNSQELSKSYLLARTFAIGGFSGCTSTCIIQPVDMVKVQIQARSESLGKGSNVSPFTVIREMFSNGKGMRQFYKGLDSALMRQITYTTTRMGIYKTLFNRHEKNHGSVPMAWKLLFSLSAGFFGSLTGNPADLILVRLQLDSTLPVEKRRGYTGFFDAFSKIVRNEGVRELWRGASPTVVRAMVLNFGMLGPFDEIKERLNRYYGVKDTIKVRLIASACAGFLCSFFSLPFDNAKTKMQRMVARPDGTMPYRNIFHCLSTSVANEGFTRLWVGFPTFYCRIAPHAMMTLLIQDYIYSYLKSRSNK
jgi:solute carrier family 25 oxoglutarate transporter 11